jgi:hypothetical protein
MFNSLKYAKKLEEVGVSREQAEVHMQIMSEIVETNLATKQDIIDVRRDIKDLETKLENRIGQFETKVDSRFEQVDAKFAQLESKFDGKFAHFDLKLTNIEDRIVAKLGKVIVGAIAVYTGIIGAMVALATYLR